MTPQALNISTVSPAYPEYKHDRTEYTSLPDANEKSAISQQTHFHQQKGGSTQPTLKAKLAASQKTTVARAGSGN